MDIAVIKKKLIESCLTYNPSLFKESLMSPLVRVDFLSKVSFYDFYKLSIECAKRNTKGEIYLDIEHTLWGKEGYTHYNFYDKIHVYPRLTIYVKNEGDYLRLDIPPF
jgi:hypothetical protein